MRTMIYRYAKRFDMNDVIISCVPQASFITNLWNTQPMIALLTSERFTSLQIVARLFYYH